MLDHELNLGFERGTPCQAHDLPVTAYLNGIHRVSGYPHPVARHEWRCASGCRVALTIEEEREWGWRLFMKASQLLRLEREQKPREERLYSAEDIIEMLKVEGMEVEPTESADSEFSDSKVTRVTFRWKPLQ